MRTGPAFNQITLSWIKRTVWSSGYLVAVLLTIPSNALSQDLSRMSVEELVSLDITSVSKRPEKVLETPASVYIVTNEDIRRSGATTVWDALRLVPGMQVLKQGADYVATGIRIKAEPIDDKMLVLQDGRALNDPLFNNVIWPFEDLLLEDIERIEVIRGAAGVLWGENAVSGLVNIITKKAHDTQGWITKAGAGSYEKGFASARYGGQIGVDTFYRTFVKASYRGENKLVTGDEANDGFKMLTTGFRVDSDLSAADKLEVDGELTWGAMENFESANPEFFNLIEPDAPETSNGTRDGVFGHVRGKWIKDLGEESNIQVQAYAQRVGFDNVFVEFDTKTADLDFQHRLPLFDSNDFVWGLGYRVMRSDVDPPDNGFYSFDPEVDTLHLFSSFINDEIDLVEDVLKLSLGSKFTHNDYTGWELQPGARLAYLIDPKTTAYGAFTRAVRTPSRLENDVGLTLAVFPPEDETSVPTAVTFRGNDDVQATRVDSYELGVRRQLADNLFVDLGTFFSRAHDTLSTEPAEPTLASDRTNPYFDIPVVFENNLQTDHYGGEIAADYRPTDALRFVVSYSYLDGDTSEEDPTFDVCDESPESISSFCLPVRPVPKNTIGLQASYDLTAAVSVDAFFKYIDSYSTNVLTDEGVYAVAPDFSILDLRVGWRITDNIELAVVGQNLIDDGHVEHIEELPPTEIQRSFYGQVTVTLP